MDIEIRTDNNIDGDADMVEKAKSEVEKSLGRFDTHVTSIHMHFSDASAREASALQRPLPDGALQIVAKGERKDGEGNPDS